MYNPLWGFYCKVLICQFPKSANHLVAPQIHRDVADFMYLLRKRSYVFIRIPNQLVPNHTRNTVAHRYRPAPLSNMNLRRDYMRESYQTVSQSDGQIEKLVWNIDEPDASATEKFHGFVPIDSFKEIVFGNFVVVRLHRANSHIYRIFLRRPS